MRRDGDQRKLERIAFEMEQAGLDALVCRLPEHVFYLTGYWPLSSFSFVVHPRNEESLLIVPEGEADSSFEDFTKEGWVGNVRTFAWGTVGAADPLQQIGALLKEWYGTQGRLVVGYEGSSEAVAPCYNAGEPLVPAAPTVSMLRSSFERAEWQDASRMLDELKAIKTGTDLEGIRLANEVAGFGIKAFRALVQPGIREVELAAQVEARIAVEGMGHKGARRVRAWAFVMSGPQTREGYRPFNLTTTRRLQQGEPVLLELATVVDGYWSDLTRMHVAGRPSARLEEIFSIVLEAQQSAVKAVEAGAEASAVDRIARDIIQRAGYGDCFRHHTGHGVGFRYHEPIPLINPASKGVRLEPGMVTTVEPAIYTEDLGVRIEDDVVVLDGGNEVLSPFDRSLDGNIED